jgi:predicted phosphodiesterase
VATAAAVVVALVVLLPPRGEIDEPEYYAYGPDIPRALRAVEAATRSRQILDEELNAQLVGLARLVVDPAQRPEIEGYPRMTIASDLHNNVLALPILDRTARNGPVLFVGDATDRGSPLETTLVRQIVRTGSPFVFVSGNHDSDSLVGRLARDGATVLTQFGQLRPNGTLGDIVVRVAGARVAGYSDPFERRSAEDFQDRYDRTPSVQQQVAFAEWFRELVGRVDVVMVHEPSLLALALEELRESPPPDPIVFATGHTHRADLERLPNVTVINGGSVGGGGTGNLAEESTPLGLAVLVYDRKGRFRPLAGDLVGIEPGTGSSTARRERLDVPAAD